MRPSASLSLSLLPLALIGSALSACGEDATGISDSGPPDSASSVDAQGSPDAGGGDALPEASSDGAPVDAPADTKVDPADGGDGGDGEAGAPVVPLSPIALVGGGRHACAILASGVAKCWGAGAFGQLGQEQTLDRGDGPGEMGALLAPTRLGLGRRALSLATAFDSTCALLDDGAVKCWGRNGYGVLGNGDGAVTSLGGVAGSMGDALPRVNLGINRVAVAIAGGDDHMCALFTNGEVKCWGRNTFGQLGLGDAITRGDAMNQMGQQLPVVNLGTGRRATQLCGGALHTCSVLDSGSLKCWGRNNLGQLGLEDRSDRGLSPNQMGDQLPAVKLGAGRTASEVACGYAFTCARLDDGSVKCWGSNANGVLGQGVTAADIGGGPNQMGDALAPIALGPGRVARKISAGELHACALLDDDTVKCWGNNASGRLGLGDTVARGTSPAQMGASLPAVLLGAGRKATALAGTRSGFTCARLDGGSVKCWGGNTSGRLGLGDTAERGSAANQMGDLLPAVVLE